MVRAVLDTVIYNRAVENPQFGKNLMFTCQLGYLKLVSTQRVGIASAKAAGKFKGRAPTAPKQAPAILERKGKGEKPVAIAKAFGIIRASVFRVLKDAAAG